MILAWFSCFQSLCQVKIIISWLYSYIAYRLDNGGMRFPLITHCKKGNQFNVKLFKLIWRAQIVFRCVSLLLYKGPDGSVKLKSDILSEDWINTNRQMNSQSFSANFQSTLTPFYWSDAEWNCILHIFSSSISLSLLSCHLHLPDVTACSANPDGVDIVNAVLTCVLGHWRKAESEQLLLCEADIYDRYQRVQWRDIHQAESLVSQTYELQRPCRDKLVMFTCMSLTFNPVDSVS